MARSDARCILTVAAMADDYFHLALAFAHDPDRDTLAAIADATGRTAYDVRLRLRGGVPKSIARVASVEAAQMMAAKLHGPEITTIVYREAGLPPMPPFETLRIARGRAEMRFANRRDEQRIEPDENISLIVYGRRPVVTRTSEFRSTSKLMGPVSVAGAGARMSIQRVVKKNVDTELFIHFFPRDPGEQPIELPGGRMNYDCLGKHRGPSDMANMQRLIAAIEKFLPDVPVDKRLMEAGAGGSDAVFYNRRSGAPASTAIATLIHWQHLAERSGRRHYTAIESLADPRD